MSFEEKAQEFVQEGKQLAASGHHAQAVKCFSKALSYCPTAEYYLLCAKSHYAIGDEEKARANFASAEQYHAKEGSPAALRGELAQLRAQLLDSQRGQMEKTMAISLALKEKRLSDLLALYDLDKVKGSVTSLAQPCLRLTAGDQPIATASSKFGGAPDLPPSALWPRTAGGVALSFIAQINFKDFNSTRMASTLPQSGLACFFYDAVNQPSGDNSDQQSSWAVQYFSDTASLCSSACPSPSAHKFTERRINASEFLSLPAPLAVEICDLNLSREEHGRYTELYWRWQDRPAHQLLGNPCLGAYDMRALCHVRAYALPPGEIELEEDDFETYEEYLEYLQSLEQNEKSESTGKTTEAEPIVPWQLFLQIDSDSLLNFKWITPGQHDHAPSPGFIYFCLEPGRLAARDFGNVWLQRQIGPGQLQRV